MSGDDDLLGLLQSMGGIRDSLGGSKEGSNGRGKRIVVALKGGSLGDLGKDNDDVWDGSEGFDDPEGMEGEEEDISRLVVRSLIDLNKKSLISGAVKSAAIMEVVRNRSRERVHRCEICNGWEVVEGGGRSSRMSLSFGSRKKDRGWPRMRRGTTGRPNSCFYLHSP